MDRTTGAMTAYRHDAEEAARARQRPGHGPAPRPPRRPLDRHAECGPQTGCAPTAATSSTTAAVPTTSRGPERQRRHRHHGGPRGAALARHLRRRPRALRPGDGALHPFPRTTPTDPASLSGDRVSSIAEAADGRLWVGTMEKGLNLLDPRSGRFQRFEHRPDDPRSLPSDVVHTPLRGRGGDALGGHARRPRPSASRTAAPSRPSARETASPSDVVYGVRSDQPGPALAEHEQRAVAASTRAAGSSRTTA